MKISFWTTSLIVLLAGRLLANTIVVTTALDQFDTPSGPEISLREAIRDVDSDTTTIRFDASLSNKLIELEPAFGSLEISNPNPSTPLSQIGQLNFDATSLELPPRISAPNLAVLRTDEAIFKISGRSVRMRNLVIEHSSGGGIHVDEAVNLTLEEVRIRYCTNYAVHFEGLDLVLRNCEIHGNCALCKTPAIWFDDGVKLLVSSSSIYQNSGRGIYANVGSTTGRSASFFNVTIAENVASYESDDFGGIFIEGPLETEVSQCTVADNLGGGIGASSPMTQVYSSIIARNLRSEGEEILNLSDNIVSLGYNLSDTASEALNEETDIVNADPKLTRIGYYGGQAPVCYPETGSPAIDAGDSMIFRVQERDFDGRGFLRQVDKPVNGQSDNLADIGAVEVKPGPLYTYTVTQTHPQTVGSLQFQLTRGSIRGNRRIVLDSSLSGAELDFSQDITLFQDTTIVVDGSNLTEPVTLSSSSRRTITIDSSSNLTLHNVNITPFIEFGVKDTAGLGLSCSMVSTPSSSFFSTGSFISAEDQSRVVMNQCDVSLGNSGALLARNSSFVQTWNCTFTGVEPLQKNERRIIVSSSDRAVDLFNVTTFNTNGALSSSAGLTVLRYCSFFDSAGSGVALSFTNNASSRVHACLFDGNQTTSGSTTNADLTFPATSSPQHIIVSNLTTNSIPFFGFQTRGLLTNRITDQIMLRPFGEYGGKVRAQPQSDDSLLLSSNFNSHRRAIDVFGQGPFEGRFIPGAVSIALPDEVFANITSVARSAGRLVISVTRSPGSEWIVYGGSDLASLSATSTTLNSSGVDSLILIIPLPTPTPDRYFVVLREQ